MTKVKRFLSTALCALTILGSVVGVTGLVYAGNSKLDVTASNVTGVTSKDPYSLLTQKDDNDQNFYVKLTSLSNGNAMSFISYSSAHVRVSSRLRIENSQVGTTRSHKYDVQNGVQGGKYYLYAEPDLYYTDVRAIGTYCP